MSVSVSVSVSLFTLVKSFYVSTVLVQTFYISLLQWPSFDSKETQLFIILSLSLSLSQSLSLTSAVFLHFFTAAVLFWFKINMTLYIYIYICIYFKNYSTFVESIVALVVRCTKRTELTNVTVVRSTLNEVSGSLGRFVILI